MVQSPASNGSDASDDGASSSDESLCSASSSGEAEWEDQVWETASSSSSCSDGEEANGYAHRARRMTTVAAERALRLIRGGLPLEEALEKRYKGSISEGLQQQLQEAETERQGRCKIQRTEQDRIQYMAAPGGAEAVTRKLLGMQKEKWNPFTVHRDSMKRVRAAFAEVEAAAKDIKKLDLDMVKMWLQPEALMHWAAVLRLCSEPLMWSLGSRRDQGRKVLKHFTCVTSQPGLVHVQREVKHQLIQELRRRGVSVLPNKSAFAMGRKGLQMSSAVLAEAVHACCSSGHEEHIGADAPVAELPVRLSGFRFKLPQPHWQGMQPLWDACAAGARGIESGSAKLPDGVEECQCAFDISLTVPSKHCVILFRQPDGGKHKLVDIWPVFPGIAGLEWAGSCRVFPYGTGADMPSVTFYDAMVHELKAFTSKKWKVWRDNPKTAANAFRILKEAMFDILKRGEEEALHGLRIEVRVPWQATPSEAAQWVLKENLLNPPAVFKRADALNKTAAPPALRFPGLILP
ncbi:unnamed protein product [Chrysoparadoxa australica]